MNEGGNYIFRKLSKINFAKINTQNTTKVISVPEHLNQSIVQYADGNGIRFVAKICLDTKIKIEQ